MCHPSLLIMSASEPGRPESEVLTKAKERGFTAEHRLRIL
jgi:hypothetical protein